MGVAKKSSMMVPCMVKSWCIVRRQELHPGEQLGPLISASRPTIMKNTNAVTIYMIPICLRSVVRSSRARATP